MTKVPDWSIRNVPVILGVVHCYRYTFKKRSKGQKQCLTRDGADVMVVIAAAVAGDTVLVTSAPGDVPVIGLVASIPAGRVGDNCNGKTTPFFKKKKFCVLPAVLQIIYM